MAGAGRVLGEAWIVISPETSDFLADLTVKVKAAVQGVPQQNVKVGADTSPAAAAVAKLKTDLTAALSQLQTVKIGADGGAITKVMADITAKAAALQKQMANMVLAADTAKFDAQIAKKNVELARLRQQLRSLEMGADTSIIDAAIRKETASLFRLREQMSKLKMEADDADLAYKIARDDALLDTLNKKIAEKRKLGADTSLLEAQLEAVETRLALLRQRGRIVLSAEQSMLFATLVATENKLERLRAEASGIRLMNPAQVVAMQAQIAAVTAEIERLNDEAAKARLGDPEMLAKFARDIAGIVLEVNKLTDSLQPPSESLVRMRETAADLSQVLIGMRIDGDDTALAAKLAALRAQAARLNRDLLDENIGDPAKTAVAAAAMASLVAGMDKFQADMAKAIPMPATEELADLQKRAAELAAQLGDIKVQGDDAGMKAQLAALQAQAVKLQATLADTAIGGDPVKMAAMTAGVERLAANTEKFTGDAKGAGTATGLWAGYMGRFAASAQGIGWGAMIGGVAGWHILLDAAIEATIIAIGVTAALAAAYAGLGPAIDQVGYQQKAALGVMTSYGVDAGALAGHLDSLQKALAPQVIEAFGGGLDLLGRNLGAVKNTAREVAAMFDTWIAKIDIWSQHNKSMNGIMQAGVGYLAQLGKAVGVFAQAIDNMLTKDPGIAHYLLDLIQGIASALNWFSKLPGPVVEATLMLHGFYIWASVLGGVLSKLTKPLQDLAIYIAGVGAKSREAAAGMALLKDEEVAGTLASEGAATSALAGALGKAGGAAKNFAAGLVALAADPLTWVIGAAAVLGIMAYQMTQTSAAGKEFIATMETGLTQVSGGTAITKISTDVGQLNKAIQQTPEQLNHVQDAASHASTAAGHAMESMIKGLPESLASWHNLGAEIGHTGSFLGNVGKTAVDAATGLVHFFQEKNDVAAYKGEIVKLNAEQTNMFRLTGQLIESHNKLGISVKGTGQAFALMDAAGVQASDSFDVMQQKIKNLVAGYNQMSVGGPMLQNSINAVSFATEMQDSKVATLNSAWDGFFKMIAGGSSDFLGFAQQVNGMNQAFANTAGTGTTLSISNGKVSDSIKAAATAATGGKATMTGLNNASIAAQQTLLQTANAANTQMDSLTTLAAAAGLGTKGTGMLTQASKDMLAQMLPAAKGSQQMTDVLYALAQRGGYTGANSFKALSEWVGKTKDPMTSLQGIVTTFSTKAANLTQDVQNLSVALGTTLNNAMAAAMLQATGGQKQFDAFATAVLNSHGNLQKAEPSARALAQQLVNLTGNTTDAKKEFLAFAQDALHLTSQQANDLWNSISKNLTPALNDTAGKAAKAKTDFEAFAGKSGGGGLGLTTKEADILWKKLQGPLGTALDDLAKSKAPGAKTAFEKLAGDKTHGLGLTKAQADELWNMLHGKLGQELSALAGANGDVFKSKAAFEAWAGDKTHGLGKTKEQADLLWTALGGSGKGGLKQAIDQLPTNKTIKISADTTQANKNVDTLQQRLDKVSGMVTGRLGVGGAGLPISASRLQHGGLIMHGSGPTADDVHLMASRGEYVMRAAAVSHYGTGVMDALNAGALPPRLLGAATGHRASGGPGFTQAAAGGLIGYAAGGPVGYQAGGAVAGGGGGGGGASTASLAGVILQLSSQLQVLFAQKIPAWLSSFATLSQVTFTKITSSMQTTFAAGLSDMFTTKMPGWLTATETSFKKTWDATAGTFHDSLLLPVQTFFISTVPGWLTTTGNEFRTTWAQAAADFRTALANPVQQFFTGTIPADFQALDTKARATFDDVSAYFGGHVDQPISKAISAWSGDISDAFKAGWNATAAEFNSGVVNWINANILKGLPGSLSLQKIPQFAGGGVVNLGSGPAADDVHALLSRGEVVVPTAMVSAGAVDHLRGKLPGFAAGGQVPGLASGGSPPTLPKPGGAAYVNPVGRGAVPARIDMGVDYTGTFDLFALGAGQIRNLYNSGWPGGTYITLQLAEGQYAGDLWYYAENISPSVRVGQQVKAGDKIGHAPGGYPWTELGWSANATGLTSAAAAGQQNKAGDPGEYSTAYGVLASNLIASLGGPAGIVTPGGIRGNIRGLVPTPMGGGSGGLVQWQVLEGLLDSTGTKLSSKTAALSQFVQGGAKQLLSLAQKGAQAIFDEIWKDSVKPKLNALPQGTMPGAYIQSVAGLLDKGISGYMKAQDSKAQSQAATMGSNQGGGFINPVSGPADASPSTAAFYARGQLGAHGWGATEWGALQNLWIRESGFSRFANNPSSGAYGIAQALPPTKYPLAGQASGGSHASPQVDWGLNYIKGRYGSPSGAWAHEVSNNWYDQGGVLPPGMTLAHNTTGHDETILPMPPDKVASIVKFAAGGIAGYQQALAADQTAEARAYAAFVTAARYALAHAATGSYVAGHHASILSEMGTLGKRQASEVAAYKPVTSANLTAGDISKFITAMRSEVTTSKDVALGHLPGRTLTALRNLLVKMETRAQQEPNLPLLTNTSSPGFPTWKTPTGTVALADFWALLATDQGAEKTSYSRVAAGFKSSLAAAKAGSWDNTHRGTISNELTVLAKKQNEELSAYTALMKGKGYQPVKAALDHFVATLKSAAVTAMDKDLSHSPGGHPMWMQGLYASLGTLYQLAGKRIGDPVTPFSTLTAPALPKPGTPEYITLAGIYGWYDRGGILPPGLTLAYNGTGRNEVVSPVPPGGVIGPGGMSHGEMQIINRLDRLISATSANPAAFSQALNGVAGMAASRGYYGAGR